MTTSNRKKQNSMLDWARIIRKQGNEMKTKTTTISHKHLTIVIYDRCGEEPITYFTVNQDIRDLNGVYINVADTDKEDKLLAVMYTDPKTCEEYAVKLSKKFPIKRMTRAIKAGINVHVIVCGFVP